MKDIRAYVKADAGLTTVPELMFGRTAVVNEVRFWLWGYAEGSKTYYVDVAALGEQVVIGMGSGEN